MRTALVVGSGERVVGSALPALVAAGDRIRIGGVFSRRAKRIEAAGQSFDVAPLEALDGPALAAADLLYLVVAKPAVPEVLRQIVAHDVSGLDLLIETPVMRFRQLGHLHLLAPFRQAWVSEDTVCLPAWDAVEAFRAARGLGPVRRATLERSAYAYHGLAMGRALVEGGRVLRGRRTSVASGVRREVHFEGGGELVALEPRDYAVGRVRLECEQALISDDPADRPRAHRLAALLSGDECAGFRVDDVETALDPAERALMGTPLGSGPDPEAAGVTVWMEGMKRVGFLRLLRRIADGAGAYPLERALEDTVVDHHLERLGRYRPNPLTTPRGVRAPLFLRALTRLGGG